LSSVLNPINDPPVAVDDADATFEDSSTTVDVLDNDSDIDGPFSPRVLSVGMPTRGTTENINGVSVVYTPMLNFNGTDTFAYTISDGILTDTATVTITVVALNDPPVAVADTYAITQNFTLTVSAVGVLNNDSDPENDSLIAILVASPLTGTLTLAASGAFTYTPDADFSGVDNFTYKASDGSILNSNTVTVTINVNPPSSLSLQGRARADEP
jgi:VCBS repeat-containing protein